MKSRSFVGAKYRIRKKLGRGAFGIVYRVHNQIDDQDYAIKLEPSETKHPQLLKEAEILQKLKSNLGIPKVYDKGTQGNVNFMVMDLLGPSLEECFNKYSRSFSLKTVLQIGMQLIQRLEYIHGNSIIHRDIKPENMLIGRLKNSHILYLVDFGLTKKYKNVHSNLHIKFRDKKNLTGTARYASINSHLGYELSRRDDIESFLYNLLYLIKGGLPWQGAQTDVKDPCYKQILDLKMNLPPEELCKHLPYEFEVLIKYSRSLRFEEKPDYNFIMKSLIDIAKKEQFSLDNIFPWTKIRRYSKTLSISENFNMNCEAFKRLKPKSKSAAIKRRNSTMEIQFEKTEEIIPTEDKNPGLSIDIGLTERKSGIHPEFQDREKIFKAVHELKLVSGVAESRAKEFSCLIF